jgi:hypothetical protein
MTTETNRTLPTEQVTLADWDLCDEHQTTFPAGDVCPSCVAERDDSPVKDSDEEADQW